MDWNTEIELPLHLDEPQTLFLWSIDELLPFSIMIVVGIITEWFVVSALIGIIGVYFFRRYKDNQPEGFLLHLAYWVGAPMRGRCLIPSYLRRVLPL